MLMLLNGRPIKCANGSKVRRVQSIKSVFKTKKSAGGYVMCARELRTVRESENRSPLCWLLRGKIPLAFFHGIPLSLARSLAISLVLLVSRLVSYSLLRSIAPFSLLVHRHVYCVYLYIIYIGAIQRDWVA